MPKPIEPRPGDVYDYTPLPTEYRADARWCREGTAIATELHGRVVLVDTYWRGTSPDAHFVSEDELENAVHRFNLGDYRALSHPGASIEWEQYAPADRQIVTRQHGCTVEYYVRIGATPDLDTKILNAEAALIEARERLESARFGVQLRQDELAALMAQQFATTPLERLR